MAFAEVFTCTPKTLQSKCRSITVTTSNRNKFITQTCELLHCTCDASGDKTSEQVAAGQTQRETEPETRNVLLEDDILEFLRRRAAGAYDGIKENDDEVGEVRLLFHAGIYTG